MELRSLSVQELNNPEITNGHDSEEDPYDSSDEGKSICLQSFRTYQYGFSFASEFDSFDDEDQCFLSLDFWDKDVVTTFDSSSDFQQHVANLMSKCRSLVKMIKKSTCLTRYMDKLKMDYKIERSLSIDCKSRWNSTKFMIENLLIFKPLIVQLHADKHDLPLLSKQKQKLANLELNSDEWRLVTSFDNILAPFYHATKLISGHKYCTIGTALFAIRKMKRFFETMTEHDFFSNEMKIALLSELERYIDDDEDQLEFILVSSDKFY